MPAPWGVTTDGFNKKTLDDLTTEIEASERSDIDPSLNLGADSVFGQLNGIFADKLRELWDLAQAVYRSLYPDSAEGDALDNIASLTGVTRQAATKSTATVTISGDPATVIPVGRVISVATTGDRFVTLAEVIIGGGGSIDAEVEAEETGPIAAPTGTLTVIETPVSGWDSVTNAADAELGTNEETDSELRTRRLDLLFNPGAGVLESILANVSEVVGVSDTFAFENTTMLTDADGLPAKSFEVVVAGGDDTAIAQAIFDKKPIGIQAYGSTTEAIADSQGVSHDISFSRPEEVEIWIEIEVSVNASLFGGGVEAEGITQVQDAIIALEDVLGIGDDVIALKVQCEALEVVGVVDVTDFKIDIVDPPVGTGNVSLTNREIATFDSARIAVTVVLV